MSGPSRDAPARDSGRPEPWQAGASDLEALASEISRQTGARVTRSEPLAGHTTMRVGGSADLLAIPRDVPGLVGLVRAAGGLGLPLTVLGRGSDVVIADAGIRGLVVLSRAEGCRIAGRRLIAESGLPLARAAELAERAGLSGLEFGLAIPGTVGGAVWANAGAHGTDVAAVLESVTVLRAAGPETTEPVSSLALGYRDSRFKHNPEEGSAGAPLAEEAHQAEDAAPATQPVAAAAAPSAAPASPDDLILSATFLLTPADPGEIKSRMNEVRRWRQEHQPLNRPSAGSVFRNPPGDSAGRLIDACGLKGRRIGGALISEKHANFIVNEGGATAADIRRLAELARREVRRQFGIELVYEIHFVGDWSGWVAEVEETGAGVPPTMPA
ncbi:MAG: UDP-N-acetylmuramate dehydrogenase [Candidatus Limnocylindrales bacterium]